MELSMLFQDVVNIEMSTPGTLGIAATNYVIVTGEELKIPNAVPWPT